MVDNLRSLRPAREPWDPAVHGALPGVRFVTPEQYLAAAPQVVRRGMVNYTVIAALADAADADGVLLDLDLSEFYRTPVAKVLSRDLDEDEQASQLVYDTFTAMALMDCPAHAPARGRVAGQPRQRRLGELSPHAPRGRVTRRGRGRRRCRSAGRPDVRCPGG
jgi:hypothetical protein